MTDVTPLGEGVNDFVMTAHEQGEMGEMLDYICERPLS